MCGDLWQRCIDALLQLPDGTVIKIGRERFQAPEILFQPDLLEIEVDGLSKTVFDCIQSCDVDTRSDLYQHIVLSGGTSMLAGLPSRLEKDVRQLYLENVLKGRKEGLKVRRLVFVRFLVIAYRS